MCGKFTPYLKEVEFHFDNELIPFWKDRLLDTEYGGYLTYFDASGNPTGETDKALLTQARCLYSLSAAHRAGRGKGRLLELARRGFDFLIEFFWDEEYPGWHWIVSREGSPVDSSKVVYGFSFVIYGLCEYYLASGEGSALSWAQRTMETLQEYAADGEKGGFFELFEPDWRPKPGGPYGGDRKTFDVHMHLLESFTKMYKAGGDESVRKSVLLILDLIIKRMIHPEHGVGISQFTFDWKPLQAILFKTVWGADRDVEDVSGRPLDNTSYGHNVELGWLMNETVTSLGLDDPPYKKIIRRLYEHCLEYGIDWEKGGVYCEGPFAGQARERNKEFWQQAEGMTAMLDGFELFQEQKYWDAYRNIHRFVFDSMINHDVGEWRPLLSPDNDIIWDYMGTAWKVNYHTIRAMLECAKRLRRMQID